MGEECLRVHDVVVKAYQAFIARHGAKEIIFPKLVESEIADDSDYDQTHIGCMGYHTVALLCLDGKPWAMGFGEKCGDYPGGQYTCDLIALESQVMEPSVDELIEQVSQSTYFRNSLLVGLRDGTVRTREQSIFGHKIVENLGDATPYVAQFAGYDTSLHVPRIKGPAITKVMLYKPAIVDALADAIEKTLRETANSSREKR